MTGFDGIGGLGGFKLPVQLPQGGLPQGLGGIAGAGQGDGQQPVGDFGALFGGAEVQNGGDETRRPRLRRGGGSDLDVGGAITDALGEVAALQDQSKAKAEALARGENVELHDVFIASGKSDVAFNLMLEIRNKLLEAWQTISRSAV